MRETLLKEVTKKGLQTWLDNRTYKKLYFPNFFPLKSNPSLTFETLIGDQKARVVADITGYNSPAPIKSRPAVNTVTGKIPPLRVKRKMDEEDIYTYEQLKNRANSDQKEILDLVYKDTDYVVESVRGRMEWLALQALSLGKVTITGNNNGVPMKYDIDFQVPDSHKKVVDTVWSDTGNSAPIDDIDAITEQVADEGYTLKYMLMNRKTFNRFRKSQDVMDFAAPYALYGGTREKRPPSQKVINEALREDGKPEIVVVDSSVGIEGEDGTITYTNPFRDNFVTFLPQAQSGNMLVAPTAEELRPPKQVTQAKRDKILVSKFSEVDPVAEFTKGEANAFPSWNNVDRTWILDTENTSTFNS